MRASLLRAPLAAAAVAAAVAAVVTPARAQPEGSVDFAQVNILTPRLSTGAVGSFDADRGSFDLGLGLTAATARFLGLEARALDLRMAARPNARTTELAASLADVDAWMVGTSSFDSSLCFWRPGVLCDGSTGFFGLGGSLLTFDYDTQTARAALRAAEIDLLGSPTPAFGAGWKNARVVGRAGASLEGFWNGGSSAWLGRASIGFDALVRVGAYELRPSFRWRPSFAAPGGDYGLEGTLAFYGITTWRGFDAAGDTERVGVEIGYGYWSDPSHAFGVDWLVGERDTAFVRVVLAPSLFTAAPP